MTAFDFSPLFRTTVGFERLAKLLDNASRLDTGSGYPPYNIEALDKDQYRITMAVAGFAEDELTLETEQNILKIIGKKADEREDGSGRLLYRGIANRSFERRFQLADFVKVTNAAMENGLLHIDLVREIPEAMKPRTIAINGSSRLIEAGKEEAA